MHPVLPSSTDLALFDAAHTRQIELREHRALPDHTLMQRAGLAAAQLAMALAPHARSVWVAAGPGNNGGDGLEAAIHLRRWGKQVNVSLVGDPLALPPDAANALMRAQAAGVLIASGPPPTLTRHDIALDALLGVGASRPAEGALAQAIVHLNALACPVLAIDVPTGLNADTGQPFGAACVVAAHTVSLLTLKPGLFTGSGRDHSGRVWFDALGVDTSLDDPQAWLGTDVVVQGHRALRQHALHKGSFGDVAVVGGAAGMTGAVLLAARAALASGAGRVFVEALDHGLTTDTVQPELMFRPTWSDSDPQTLRQATVVCGCGGGDAVRMRLARILSLAGRLVLDADALNTIATDSALQALLTQRSSRKLPTVLTPHPLEAGRLLSCSAATVQNDRLSAAQTLANKFRCTVVLKGSGSVIATPNEKPRINSTGNAALATAGTGDVLAGWLGGLWAQSSADTPRTIVQRAVREHGAAAEPPPRGPLCASDLIKALKHLGH